MRIPIGSLRRMYEVSLLTLIAITAPGSSIASAASWVEINTGLTGIPLSVNSLVIDPASPSTIYAQTISNINNPTPTRALYKSTDAAATWKPVSGVSGVTALVLDPKNSSVIYAATDQGIAKSTNGGETWLPAGDGLPNGFVLTLAIDPLTTSNVYAVMANGGPAGASVGGIYKSTNGGGSWRMLNTGLPAAASISLLAIDPVTPATLYVSALPFAPPPAGGPALGMILKSMDAGQSWTALNLGLPPPGFFSSLVFDPGTPGRLYAVAPSFGGPATLFRSSDGGKTWNRLTGVPNNTSISSLILDPQSPATLYGVISSFTPPGPPTWAIGKSTDAGDHWTVYDVPTTTSISFLALDPSAPSRIYAAAAGFSVNGSPTPAGGVFKSTDGGQSWSASNRGLVSYEIRTLAAHPVDGDTLYAGGFGGAFKTADAGTSWNSTGLTAYTGSLVTDLTNPNVLYAQTGRSFGCNSDERLLLRTSDGGASWQDTVSPRNSGCILNASFRSPRGAPMAIDQTDPNILYLGESDDQDGYSAILKSTDGGANWIVAWDWFSGLRGAVNALALDPSRPATLYAGIDGDSGGLFKSTDGGLTWTNTGAVQAGVSLLALAPANSLTIYAVGAKGLLKSADGGSNWTTINNGLAEVIGNPLIAATSLVVDRANSNLVYLGTSTAGVFRSTDGGTNWTPLNDGLLNLQIRALTIGRNGTAYAATAAGIFKLI